MWLTNPEEILSVVGILGILKKIEDYRRSLHFKKALKKISRMLKIWKISEKIREFRKNFEDF
jgi:hypothetical protein